MKLLLETIKNGSFDKLDYILPKFDIEAMRKKTLQQPTWLHFGAGNILRAFPCVLCQKLLDSGEIDTGMIVVETYDEEIIEKAFTPYDDLCVAVSLKSNGTLEKRIVASVAKAYGYSKNINEVIKHFSAPSLQMVSLTITEKGYSITDASGIPLSYCKEDFENSNNPSTTIGILVKCCLERFKANAKPLTLVSMDNCAHNGTILKNALLTIAKSWENLGLVKEDFINYLENDIYCTWSMIDKITPRPAPIILEKIEKDNLEDMDVLVTSKNTYVSALVNAEECEYLAIEDNFANGRPPLEKVGVLFGTREQVDRIEKMKVCTCLNPLHTALAIYGCLLGHTSIFEEMGDDILNKFVMQLGYVEGMPVVVDPGIMSAKTFIDEVITRRLPNPFVPDTPQRIACDTSKKLPVRFGETLKAYCEKGSKDLSHLDAIALVFAGYARYLTGINDEGEVFVPSSDPNLETLQNIVSDYEFTKPFDVSLLHKLFSDKVICGIDLYTVGIGQKAEKYFELMNKEKGAIRQTLESVLNK